MPPRYAYWTILVDEQPTAFRAGSQEDLMPTFKRLKQKNPSAKMMWWQNGKLWDSRLDAQEAMRARGEMGRAKDFRQRDSRPGGGFRSRSSDRSPRGSFGGRESKGTRDREPREERDPSGKLEWKPKDPDAPSRPLRAQHDSALEWKPKGEALAPRDHLLRRNVHESAKPAWKPKGDRKPEWQPKGDRKPAWKPKGDTATPRDRSPRGDRAEWKPKGAGAFSRPQGLRTSRPPAFAKAPAGRPASKPRTPRDGKLEWRPKGSSAPDTSSRPQDLKTSRPPKRRWVPKEEYKKAQGIEAPRDKKWRPGGEHRDPRQKYKDAKKAKWGRFKQNIRQKWEAKQPGGKKRRDEE